ncbi:unnamed protein product [Cylindrotheca closterium]|uniref:Uncharacterized protein n=1 Tax=Cylindrotheca closterium TaxID=2856 RepID=A0AAD2FYK0_9STRA|nr:unnamed protein product [Cylindrotheca closterium]
MDTGSKARQSSIFPGMVQFHRTSHGKSSGSYFAPLQLVEKAHSFKQCRSDSCSRSQSFRGQVYRPTVSRDNASVVGRVVGDAEQVELSQMSCSQSSVMEHHDSMSMKSSHMMLQHSQKYPPLHQNSSLSNASSHSSGGYSRNHQTRLPPLRSNFYQQSEDCDVPSHCNISTHNTAGTSLASMPAPARSVQSKRRSVSMFLQRMNPRRIGSPTPSLFRKSGEHSPTKGSSTRPSHLLPHSTLPHNSALSVTQSGDKTSSSSNSSFSENLELEARINERHHLPRLQSELKAFVDKSMESIEEKSTELDRKQSQMEEESRNHKKEQDTLFEGRLHELNDAFDSKANNLNRLFHEQKSNLKSEGACWTQGIRDAGDCQMQRLSQYSQVTLKKVHDVAKTAESFLSGYKQFHTEAVQALPNMIRPMLSKMISSMLPSALAEATVAEAPLSGCCKESSDSSNTSCIGNKSLALPTRPDTRSCERITTKKRRGASPGCDLGQLQTAYAAGPSKRVRRSKRIKHSSDKENLTPTSKTGQTRPCVTPGESPKEEDHVSPTTSSTPSPSPKRTMVMGKASKQAPVRSTKKRKISHGKSSVTPLESKRVPFVIELTNLHQSSSPLTQASAHHQTQRNMSPPRGSTLKRDKRRKSYGKARPSRKPSLSNDMSDDTFSFVY